MQSIGGKNLIRFFCRKNLDLFRFRTENANEQIVTHPMRAEDAKRIRMRRIQKRGNFDRVDWVNGKRTHNFGDGVTTRLTDKERRFATAVDRGRLTMINQES